MMEHKNKENMMNDEEEQNKKYFGRNTKKIMTETTSILNHRQIHLTPCRRDVAVIMPTIT